MKAQFSRLRKTIKGAIHDHKKEKMAQQNDRHNDDDLQSLSSTLFLPDDEDDDGGLSDSSCSTIFNNSQENLPYCSSYSNLYYKLPNGNWLVQYRTRDKVVIDTFIIKGNLI